MFPTLGYLLNYLFGTNLDLGLPTFGFVVALSFLAAAWVLKKELERRFQSGIFKPVMTRETKGKPASTTEIIYNLLFGFVLGFKLGLLLTDASMFSSHPQEAILSLKGNFVTGLIGAALLAGYVYWDKKRKSVPNPVTEERALTSGELVTNITMIAAISGILGAKIFHHFEYWDAFMQDPAGQFFSFAGLTFYGGLICGFVAVVWYVRSKGLNFMHIADCVAPGLILAYGLGRLGCQLAGDGDWGVVNSAYRYVPATGTYVQVPPDSIQNDIKAHAAYYTVAFGSVDQVPYTYFEKPAALSFLPDWMFASVYPHNVNNDGIPIENCQGEYCNRLPIPVIPTPIYEIFMGLLIFAGLWFFRKKLDRPGLMFSVYLIFNGMERFFIEQFRVNSEYNILGGVTQAEIISTVLILVGIAGIILTKKFRPQIEKL
ncbi:MAG: prolipoprotein diacylglyceryl transferase [Bacteroidia bacterium]|nr:prolipoprotein diacylglyceryl transferase [Bacteroidia bacterium]